MCKITVIKTLKPPGRNPAFKSEQGQEVTPEYKIERSLCRSAKLEQQELEKRLSDCFGADYCKGMFQIAKQKYVNISDTEDAVVKVLYDVFLKPARWLGYSVPSAPAPNCPTFEGAIITALRRGIADVLDEKRRHPTRSTSDSNEIEGLDRAVILTDPGSSVEINKIIEDGVRRQLREKDRDFLELIESYRKAGVSWKDAAHDLEELSKKDVATELTGLSAKDAATKLAHWLPGLPETVASKWCGLPPDYIEAKLTNICRSPTPGNLRKRYSCLLKKLKGYDE